MTNSKIEWVHHTFNPWLGCAKVSPGCARCYAQSMLEKRFKMVKWGGNQKRRHTKPDNWKMPKRWNRAAEGAIERPRVFCASMADWLDMAAPSNLQTRLLNTIAETPNLDWLLLSKRPQNWERVVRRAAQDGVAMAQAWLDGYPPANVWLGTSAEDQLRWDLRVPMLMRIPARLHFVSAEPLLGPIVMKSTCPDWVIMGGETGSGARLTERQWVEDLCTQCNDYDIPAFFLRWGTAAKRKRNLVGGRKLQEIPVVRPWRKRKNAA